MAHDPKHAEHAHPDGATYLKVAAILTIITVIEVWAYYVPALVASPFFNPSLIIMSAAKFAIVVLFYMHLKYDHRLFRALFTGPLIIAMGTIVALLFLFHQLSIRF
jgi:cytochrome c oxidase subunit IV